MIDLIYLIKGNYPIAIGLMFVGIVFFIIAIIFSKISPNHNKS